MARNLEDRKQTERPKRRGRGFQRASDMTRGAVERIAAKQGFAEADVLLNWAAIVGAEHATKCRPVKVHYGAKSVGATLVVQTDSGRAPEIEHLGPRIIQRINAYYGYGAIRRLKITQSTGYGRTNNAPGFAEAQTPFDAPAVNPSRADLEEVSRMTQDIASPGLKAALDQMGANVLARARKTLKSKP